MFLGLLDDLVHRFDHLDGKLTDRGFSTEHDGVGPVEHGIGHIGDFGAGRARVGDHAIHHLGGHDDGARPLDALADDVFLDSGQPFHGHFDAQIATGYHDPVGSFDDLVDALDCLRLLDLGDDLGRMVFGLDALLQVFEVARRTHKGQGDPVDRLGEDEVEVFQVFFRQAG